MVQKELAFVIDKSVPGILIIVVSDTYREQGYIVFLRMYVT